MILFYSGLSLFVLAGLIPWYVGLVLGFAFSRVWKNRIRNLIEKERREVIERSKVELAILKDDAATRRKAIWN